MKQSLENVAKLLSVLTDTCKFLVLASLSSFAIAAVTQPAWARQKLKDVGLSIKEVNVFGVKLAADDGFDMAKALGDAKLNLEALRNVQPGQPSATGGSDQVAQAIAELDKIQTSLLRQAETLKSVQQQAGAVLPSVPDAGWLYVGRLAEDKTFMPGPRISAAGTRIESGKVSRLQIGADAPVVENGDECVRKTLEEIHPPSAEDLQSIQVLIHPNPAHALEVLATASCPSAGNGRWLYAKIRIQKDDVKFVKFETLLRR